MDSKEMISFDLRNLTIHIKRYLEKHRKDDRCMHDSDHPTSHHTSNGVTHMHMLVMDYFLSNKDKDIFQKDFEKEFSMRGSTATNMLKRMEKNGVIKRVPVPEDGRLKKIVLTEKALKMTENRDKKAFVLEDKLTKGFTEDELTKLSSLIKKMTKNMEEEN